MGLFGRRNTENDAVSETQLMCPICGATGRDDRAVAAGEAVFGVRPDYDGSPVRKCFACGGGFTVTGHGSTAQPIPTERWVELEQVGAAGPRNVT